LNQFLRRTNELGALKITIRKFYRASGSSTQLKGVVPDIILPSLNNHAEVGEASLPNALPWDTIPSAKYEPVNVIPPLLPELRRRSEARVITDRDFAYLRDEIERFKKAREEKTVSMNEEERRKEKRENEERAEARKKELRARPQPDYKTYELTLKNVNLPGLPPPVPKTNMSAISTGTATNAVTRANGGRTENPTNVAAKLDDSEDELKDDADIPVLDVTLEEGRRILQDLVALTTKNTTLAGPLTAGERRKQ
jgi:carboxyl-terminal processing protease